MKVELLQCERGHFYTSLQGRCPICSGGDVAVTAPEDVHFPDSNKEMPKTSPEIPEFVPVFEPPVKNDIEDISVTTPWFENSNPELSKADPVVGWLVCTAGPEKGQSWRLHTGTNFIGRSQDMDVRIINDQMISSRNACSVSYDERSRTFFIEGGDGRNNIYINSSILRSAQDLVIYDRISIGSTELMLIPFCGEQFSWSEV